MSRAKTKPKQYRLPDADIEAIQILAMAGHVINDPAELRNRTEVGAVRQALRDAWKVKFPTTPYPGEGESSKKTGE